MTAITITDEPIAGWRLEEIRHQRSLGSPGQWYCSMMRLRDGAVMAYLSPAGVKQAYEGCMSKARAEDAV